MEVALVVIAFLLMLSGIAGCVLPLLPGPPLSYAALLIVAFMPDSQISNSVLIVAGIATVVVTTLDYVIPIWGTKQFGGSKQGIWGATLGLVMGMFLFPPFGIVIGPFLGAFIGELVNNSSDTQRATKAAFGSLLGFLIGTALKLLVCLWMCYYFIIEVVKFIRAF